MLDELTHMDRITQLQEGVEQLLTLMSSSITYLCSRTTFRQVSDQLPITRTRPAAKVDPPEIFEANTKELVGDLMRKAKQVEFLINSLPVPESEEEQSKHLQSIEEDMLLANQEYLNAVKRAQGLHRQISDILKIMLSDDSTRCR